MSDWSRWWFLNGGALHRLWKSKKYTAIYQYTQSLPKMAWDEQQKEINAIRADLAAMTAERDALREAVRAIAEQAGPGDTEQQVRLQLAATIGFAMKALECKV